MQGNPSSSTSTVFRPGQNDAKHWELLPAKERDRQGGIEVVEVKARAFDYDEMTMLLSVKVNSIEADREKEAVLQSGEDRGGDRGCCCCCCGRRRRRRLGEGMWLFGGVGGSCPGHYEC